MAHFNDDPVASIEGLRCCDGKFWFQLGHHRLAIDYTSTLKQLTIGKYKLECDPLPRRLNGLEAEWVEEIVAKIEKGRESERQDMTVFGGPEWMKMDLNLVEVPYLIQAPFFGEWAVIVREGLGDWELEPKVTEMIGNGNIDQVRELVLGVMARNKQVLNKPNNEEVLGNVLADALWVCRICCEIVKKGDQPALARLFETRAMKELLREEGNLLDLVMMAVQANVLDHQERYLAWAGAVGLWSVRNLLNTEYDMFDLNMIKVAGEYVPRWKFKNFCQDAELAKRFGITDAEMDSANLWVYTLAVYYCTWNNGEAWMVGVSAVDWLVQRLKMMQIGSDCKLVYFSDGKIVGVDVGLTEPEKLMLRQSMTSGALNLSSEIWPVTVNLKAIPLALNDAVETARQMAGLTRMAIETWLRQNMGEVVVGQDGVYEADGELSKTGIRSVEIANGVATIYWGTRGELEVNLSTYDMPIDCDASVAQFVQYVVLRTTGRDQEAGKNDEPMPYSDKLNDGEQVEILGVRMRIMLGNESPQMGDSDESVQKRADFELATDNSLGMPELYMAVLEAVKTGEQMEGVSAKIWNKWVVVLVNRLVGNLARHYNLSVDSKYEVPGYMTQYMARLKELFGQHWEPKMHVEAGEICLDVGDEQMSLAQVLTGEVEGITSLTLSFVQS